MRLSIFAHDVMEITRTKAPCQLDLSPYPGLRVIVQIEPGPHADWCRCTVNGKAVGNRSGAVAEFTRLVEEAIANDPVSANKINCNCPTCGGLVDSIFDHVDGCPCDGCDGDGICPNSSPHAGELPDGYIAVERCDACMKFESDLAAAQAYGIDATERETSLGHDVICRPKPDNEPESIFTAINDAMERAGAKPIQLRREQSTEEPYGV